MARLFLPSRLLCLHLFLPSGNFVVEICCVLIFNSISGVSDVCILAQLSKQVTHCATVVLFLYFGLRTLYKALSGRGGVRPTFRPTYLHGGPDCLLSCMLPVLQDNGLRRYGKNQAKDAWLFHALHPLSSLVDASWRACLPLQACRLPWAVRRRSCNLMHV